MKYIKKLIGWLLLIFLFGILTLPMFATVGFKIGVLCCLAGIAFAIGVNVAMALICTDSENKDKR